MPAKRSWWTRKDGNPWARLVPLETDRPRRQPGLLRGQLQLPPVGSPKPQRWPHRQSTDAAEVGQVIVVWSRSVVASERLHSWLEIQGAGGLGQSAI